mmetsp:Transcript_27305/g.86771  ORF Transcript_27305/g.86771 Transcript_27305/m.86771 type:complete len:236 (+) Transcript_27305:365-1072(+)
MKSGASPMKPPKPRVCTNVMRYSTPKRGWDLARYTAAPRLRSEPPPASCASSVAFACSAGAVPAPARGSWHQAQRTFAKVRAAAAKQTAEKPSGARRPPMLGPKTTPRPKADMTVAMAPALSSAGMASATMASQMLTVLAKKPCRDRKTMSCHISCDRPKSSSESEQKKSVTIRTRLRPKASDSEPSSTVPMVCVKQYDADIRPISKGEALSERARKGSSGRTMKAPKESRKTAR